MVPASQTRTRRIHWSARLEYRFHAWRERRARKRGLTATILPFAGYGGPGWVRVLGRVLIVRPAKGSSASERATIRGWRSFLGIPVGFAQVRISVGDRTYDVVTDRGGVVDTVIDIDLPPGWQEVTMTVEERVVTGHVFVVGADVRFGVVSDVDDTVMVTALPRPLLAAWNSFVVDEHARIPVPGMAVMLERVIRQHPGAPMIYLSTGAWNIAPTLTRFLSRHLFPSGAMLLTDWGPTHDTWFRSGREHKLRNLDRLAREFPHITWLLVGDDGQHDEAIYTEFATTHPDSVAGVAIRRLSPAEAVLAGGRTIVEERANVPWVTAPDGAGLMDRLRDAEVI